MGELDDNKTYRNLLLFVLITPMRENNIPGL